MTDYVDYCKRILHGKHESFLTIQSNKETQCSCGYLYFYFRILGRDEEKTRYENESLLTCLKSNDDGKFIKTESDICKSYNQQ